MEIRLAEAADLPAIMRIVADARAFMKRNGVDQWQDGYPPVSAFEADVEKKACYVLCDGDAVLGTCSLLFGDDPNYAVLDTGAWATEDAYAAIHRVALCEAARGTGAADTLFSFCERQALSRGVRNLRVDTHADNRAMRGALKRNGFSFVGEVTLYRDTPNQMPRVAFEKAL